jgi:hypothetical protein
MKINLLSKVLAILFLSRCFVNGQGTMVYDQQSSDESNWATGGNVIQTSQPTGQSFTPSLDGVGFVRLQLFDANRNNGLGATLFVNLRSGSLNGAIIGSTDPVTLPDNFGLPLNTGFVTFYFPNVISVQPGTAYFIEPIVQTGDSWAVAGDTFNYAGGSEYVHGTAFTSDYWFREGVIVPEPSSAALCVIAAGVAVYLRTRKKTVS